LLAKRPSAAPRLRSAASATVHGLLSTSSEMAYLFGVSLEAMNWRLKNLGFHN